MKQVLHIESIKQGMPGITPVIGNYLYENCLLALYTSGHKDGTEMLMDGLQKETCKIHWNGQITDQMLRSYADETVTTEEGAVCISALTALRLTDFTIVERSWHGTGIDYWLGHKNDPLLQRAARLEISGIKTETAKNTITARFEQKAKQTQQSDKTNLPAYISIVEFSNPKILFDIKR